MKQIVNLLVVVTLAATNAYPYYMTESNHCSKSLTVGSNIMGSKLR